MKTYKFKLYRTKKQKHLHRRVRVAGEIYNHLITVHRRFYRLYGRYISVYRMQKHITKIKKYEKNAHWKIVGSQAIQNIIRRIDFGYQKFFRKENKRPPSFRALRKFKSFTLTQAGWNLQEDNSILIGGYKYKYWRSQEILGAPKLIHIKRDSLGEFYIFIVTDFEESAPEYATSSKSVGCDFGLKTYFKLSDGNEIVSPQFFKQNMRDLARVNRVLSRKKNGSKSRKQARKALARVHKRTANKRQDWQVKEARKLAHNYGAIFMEDLNISGMKKLWGRKVSDLAFYQQVQLLKQQCAKTGAIFHQVDRWFPSTKTCHVCSCINQAITLSDREWTCPECGTHHNRDDNASINIHNAGASALGLGIISRESPANTV